MIAFLLACSFAFADDLIRPKPPDPVAGECSKSYAIRAGERPPPGLIDPETGLARCGAVASPVSEVAYLLAVEKHRDGIERLWSLDVRTLEAERDYYRAAYLDTSRVPWYQEAAVQKWGARLETLAVVGVVGGLAIWANQGAQ